MSENALTLLYASALSMQLIYGKYFTRKCPSIRRGTFFDLNFAVQKVSYICEARLVKLSQLLTHLTASK